MRPPPDVTAAARTRGSRKGPQESITGEATTASYAGSRPFHVVIAGTRRHEWGRFATEPEAEAVAQKLRRHGFAAAVRDERGAAP